VAAAALAADVAEGSAMALGTARTRHTPSCPRRTSPPKVPRGRCTTPRTARAAREEAMAMAVAVGKEAAAAAAAAEAGREAAAEVRASSEAELAPALEPAARR